MFFFESFEGEFTLIYKQTRKRKIIETVRSFTLNSPYQKNTAPFIQGPQKCLKHVTTFLLMNSFLYCIASRLKKNIGVLSLNIRSNYN
jgi:hypothetical protein